MVKHELVPKIISLEPRLSGNIFDTVYTDGAYSHYILQGACPRHGVDLKFRFLKRLTSERDESN